MAALGACTCIPKYLSSHTHGFSQLEGGVLLDGSRAFAEGADAEDWAHWGASKKPGFR